MTLRLRVVSADGRRFEHDVDGGRARRRPLLPRRTRPRRPRDVARARPDPHGRPGLDGIEDLGSHNGTRAERGSRRGVRRLRDGDTVSLGGSVLVVEIHGEERLALGRLGHLPLGQGPSPVPCRARPTSPASAPPGRKAADRLHMLNQVNQALASSISLEELLELILDRAFVHLKPQEAAIYLRDAAGNDICAARRSTPGRESRPMHSKSLLHEVIDKGMVAHVVDSAVDERFAESKSLMMSGLRSFIAAPLLDAQGALGMIVVGAALGVRSFRDEDLELLVSLASVAALRIRNVRLVAEAMERQKLEQEVRLARQIQVALLPASLPAGPRLGAARRDAPVPGGLGRLLQDPPPRATASDLRALRRRRLGQGDRRVAPDRLARGALGAPARGERPARPDLRAGGDAPLPENASREVRDGLPRDPRAADRPAPLDERRAQPRAPPPRLRRVRVAEVERRPARPPPGRALQGRRPDDGAGRRPPRLHRRDHRGAEPGGGGVRRDRARGGGRPAPPPRRSARWRPASSATSTPSPAGSPSTTTGRS